MAVTLRCSVSRLRHHATLIPHLKLIVAQLGFGQPGGVYGEVCLDHITFDREYAMKILGLRASASCDRAFKS